MNLRAYYEQIRKIDAGIKTAEVMVVSLATPDGGREGVRSLVPRALAAKLIAEGTAVLAGVEAVEQVADGRLTDLLPDPAEQD